MESAYVGEGIETFLSKPSRATIKDNLMNTKDEDTFGWLKLLRLYRPTQLSLSVPNVDFVQTVARGPLARL